MPTEARMVTEGETLKKSRLSRSSTVSPESTDLPPPKARGIFTSAFSTLLGFAACVTIALTVPHLYPQQPVLDSHSPDVQGHSNNTRASPAFTPQQRSNETIEAALEAAVMGAFLADAASLGLHG